MADDLGEGKSGFDLQKILTFALITLNLLGCSVGLYLTYAATLGYQLQATTDAELAVELDEFTRSLDQNPVVYKMNLINTNLSGVPRRMIRMELNLEMLNAEGFEEVVDLSAEAKDSVLKIVNAKNFDELESLQGKLLLKNQIIAQLNGFLKRGVVKNVYFSDFVVQ